MEIVSLTHTQSKSLGLFPLFCPKFIVWNIEILRFKLLGTLLIGFCQKIKRGGGGQIETWCKWKKFSWCALSYVWSKNQPFPWVSKVKRWIVVICNENTWQMKEDRYSRWMWIISCETPSHQYWDCLKLRNGALLTMRL